MRVDFDVVYGVIVDSMVPVAFVLWVPDDRFDRDWVVLGC